MKMLNGIDEVQSQISELESYAKGKLLASATVEAPVFPGTAITVDPNTDTFTVEGYTLTNGDRVTFYAALDVLSNLPAGLQGGFAYYVVNVAEGGVFQVSKTSGGTVIDITSVGVAAGYCMQKLSINNISFSNLSINNRCRFVVTGSMAGAYDSGSGYVYLTLYVNNKVTGPLFIPAPSNDAIVPLNNIPLFYANDMTPVNVFAIVDVELKNNRIYANLGGFTYGVKDSDTTKINRLAIRNASICSIESVDFASISTIKFEAGPYCFLGNSFTVEVYNG